MMPGMRSSSPESAGQCRIEDLALQPTNALRVALETTGLYTTETGVARYVCGLMRGLQQLDQPGLSVMPLAWEVENLSYRQPMRAIKTAYRELFWGKLIAPQLIRRRRADLLHSTSGLFIRCPKTIKHVITLHDMTISRHPERFRKWQIYSWHRRLPLLHRADRIICISRFTADEAVQLIGLDASKIDVVHNGCDWQTEEISFEETKPDFEVPDEFFLFVGALTPGKNLKLLVEAYRMSESAGRALPPLMIAGPRWRGVETEGTPPRNFVYLGRQPDGVLLYLYRRALAMLFPSIYEGFGLPIIEAMAQGCPVVCSPRSSLPEVAGDAALMVDLTPQQYLQAMRQLTVDPDLRQDLVARGRQRAKLFTWRRCAEGTLASYQKAMQ